MIFPILETDIDAAGRTLAAAFQDDPIQIYVFPDPDERSLRSPQQFSILVREGVRVGGAFATADFGAVASWTPPADTIVPVPTMASQFGRLPEVMGREAFLRFGKLLDYLSDVHGKDMPPLHWYLAVVGVRPERRGGGAASALLAPVLRRADEAGFRCCSTRRSRRYAASTSGSDFA